MTKAPFERNFHGGPTTDYAVGTVICHGYFVGTITRVGDSYYDVTLLDDVQHFTRHIMIHRREAIRPEEAEVRRAWLDARDKRWRLERAEMLLRGAQEHRQTAWLASCDADDALRAAQEALADA